MTKGRIAAAHGRFSGIRRWRQCAIHLIHALLAHTSPQHTRHLDRFSRFAQLTAECRQACPGMCYTLKIALWHLAIWTPSNTFFFGSPESTPQTASRSVQPFLHSRRTWTVRSYSPGCANVHLHVIVLPAAHASIRKTYMHLSWTRYRHSFFIMYRAYIFVLLSVYYITLISFALLAL